MDDVIISQGFIESERGQVASLYWEAFGSKFQAGFANEQIGLAVVTTALRPNNMLVARQNNTVLGVCGFYSSGSGTMNLSWSELRQTLSIPAALRAILVLSVLSRTPSQRSLVLDGICVDSAARGLGVGTALLTAAHERAQRDGASTVRLSVIDGNPRARALYERQGFVPKSHGTLGLLSQVYGFNGYTSMELSVNK